MLPSDPMVLVVDDVRGTRTGMIELLRLRGYNALGAADGAEGLQKLRENAHVRVVVLDLTMPGTDGYWFRRQQLQEPQIARVPVIVFTGCTHAEDTSAQLGGCDVLSKPVAVDVLLDAISRYCANV